MKSLSHPNIIKLVGFVEDMGKGAAWMILPWEGNGNVREFLQAGEWDIPERMSLVSDLSSAVYAVLNEIIRLKIIDTADGLAYLHDHQPPICHGDLKSVSLESFLQTFNLIQPSFSLTSL